MIGAYGSWNYAKSNPMRRHVAIRKSASFAPVTPSELSTLNGCMFDAT